MSDENPEWFKVHANRDDPDAYININTKYFADQCAAAITKGWLIYRQEPDASPISSNDQEADRDRANIAWAPVMSQIRHALEMALARHPSVGAALTFAEGEALITKLSASLAYDIRFRVDPSYDK